MVVAAFGVPLGVDSYFFQITNAEEFGIIIADGNSPISALPQTTGFTPGDEFVASIRFAWGVGGVRVSEYGPWLPVEV
jgi:hypothetical protein